MICLDAAADMERGQWGLRPEHETEPVHDPDEEHVKTPARTGKRALHAGRHWLPLKTPVQLAGLTPFVTAGGAVVQRTNIFCVRESWTAMAEVMEELNDADSEEIDEGMAEEIPRMEEMIFVSDARDREISVKREEPNEASMEAARPCSRKIDVATDASTLAARDCSRLMSNEDDETALLQRAEDEPARDASDAIARTVSTDTAMEARATTVEGVAKRLSARRARETSLVSDVEIWVSDETARLPSPNKS